MAFGLVPAVAVIPESTHGFELWTQILTEPSPPRSVPQIVIQVLPPGYSGCSWSTAVIAGVASSTVNALGIVNCWPAYVHVRVWSPVATGGVTMGATVRLTSNVEGLRMPPAKELGEPWGCAVIPVASEVQAVTFVASTGCTTPDMSVGLGSHTNRQVVPLTSANVATRQFWPLMSHPTVLQYPLASHHSGVPIQYPPVSRVLPSLRTQ